MAQYHINGKGEPGKCSAAQGGCPFGEHYASPAEAAQAYEAQMHDEVLTSPLTKADLASSQPSFTEDDVDWNKSFALEPGAKKETKNRGEYSEFYATAHLLSSRATHFTHGADKFEVVAMRVGNREYVVDQESEDHVVMTRGVGEAKAAYVSDPDIYLDSMHSDLAKAKGKTFSSPAIQSTCVSLGFTDGRVPKAVSTSKADVVAWDKEGREHRISVKSFMGSDPALINASQQSEVLYAARLPEGHDEERLKKILASENYSTKEKITILKRFGVHFDPTKGQPRSDAFRANLATVDPEAQRAYCAAAFQAADSDAEVPEELKPAYHRTLHAFATRMTHSAMEPEENAVTDFLSVNANGSVTMTNFKTEEEAGQYFADRVRFQEPDRNRFPTTGEFQLKNGVVALRLNTFASLSANKRA